MKKTAGILLEFSDGRAPTTVLAEVNIGLAPYGSRVWPLELSGAPDDLRELLRQEKLTEAEAERIKAQFLLPRTRLLELIVEAGRAPQLPGGGALATYVANHGYAYPQLYVVEAGADYTRFDRFHVNTADDGTGVDEIGQLLCGGGGRILQRRPGHGMATLHLDCPSADHGWIVAYDGGSPHIGSLSGARAGTKMLMQVIGPERWAMRYEDSGDQG
jgi:hypothetical protein